MASKYRAIHQCQNCGMEHMQPPGDIVDRLHEPSCTKCDSPLWSLSDGSTLTVDIAHQRETVAEAQVKFRRVLDQAWQESHAGQLRLIVGGGLIRDAVLAELFYLRQQGAVLGFEDENRGVIRVRIR